MKGDIPGREKSNCKDLKEPGLLQTAGVGLEFMWEEENGSKLESYSNLAQKFPGFV